MLQIARFIHHNNHIWAEGNPHAQAEVHRYQQLSWMCVLKFFNTTFCHPCTLNGDTYTF